MKTVQHTGEHKNLCLLKFNNSYNFTFRFRIPKPLTETN